MNICIQIRVQVGHSGQCQYFISTPSSVRLCPFFSFGLFNDKNDADSANARGNYKDATLSTLYAVPITNISPMNTSAFSPFDSNLTRTLRRVKKKIVQNCHN